MNGEIANARHLAPDTHRQVISSVAGLMEKSSITLAGYVNKEIDE